MFVMFVLFVMRPPTHTLALLLLLLLPLIDAATGQQVLDPVFVSLPSGNKVQGTKCAHSDAIGFLGIPFAQPPVGELRFMPPKLVTLDNSTAFTNGLLNATTPGNTCVQWSSSFLWTIPSSSEDCLYLDVYMPPNKSNQSALPVKVFAYGGGNTDGAANYPLYDGCSLASDSVVVAFNYRLGPLGFLTLQEAGIGGNMAIQDYMAALQWVHDEIPRFGGDARKVLLFGQSAGAADSFVVSTLPQARDFIAAVALESGGGQDLTPLQLAEQVGQSYAQVLGCSTSDLKCLQGKSLTDLIEARGHIPALEQGGGKSLGSLFGINIPNRKNLNAPVLDGKIIQQEPLKKGSTVPLLTGFNEDDSSLFVIPQYRQDMGSLTDKNYSDFLNLWGNNSAAVAKQYPLSKFEVDGKSVGDAVVDAIIHVTTAAGFKCPVYKNLRVTTAAGTPAYAYLFNHTPSCSWLWLSGKESPSSQHLPLYKAAHTSELPFVFGSLVNEPWGNGSCNATDHERQVIGPSMVAAWTGMAASGNPGTDKLRWPQFSPNEARGLKVGHDSVDIATIDYSECDFWDSIWAGLGGVNVPGPNQNDSTSDKGVTSGAKSSLRQVPAALTLISAMVLALGLTS